MQQAPLQLETLFVPVMACAVVLALTARPGMALALVFVLPVMALVLVWLGIKAWRKPQLRLQCAAKAMCVVLTLCLVYGLHQLYAKRAGQHAHAVSAAVEQFRQTQGHYPSDLAQLKLHDAGAWQLRYRLAQDGTPVLSRPSTANPFDKHIYDFETRAWEFRPD